MRLLLDQGLPRRSAELLRSQGFDALHTGEIGMAEARDEEILEAISEDLARGAVASMDEALKIRVRKLPL